MTIGKRRRSNAVRLGILMNLFETAHDDCPNPCFAHAARA